MGLDVSDNNEFKGIVSPKQKNYLFTLMPFQTCMIFYFIFWNLNILSDLFM